jgi:ABC-2 type transport system ATP-binding protein
MIQARKLSRNFGDFTAVGGLDFDVAEGAICALLGPNGAGKSTTIRMLSGLERPSGGSATVCGVDVVRDPAALKRRVGVLPEDLGLFEDLTVEEHLRLSGRVYGLDKSGWSTAVTPSPHRVLTACARRRRWRWPCCLTRVR